MLYYQYDGLRTVSEVTDRHGDLIEQYRYDAFGGIFTGITSPYNYNGYTGQVYDAKTSLIDMNARWYDPAAGRFMTKDTYAGSMANPLTQNRYAYVSNNPVNSWDPTGHSQQVIRGGGGEIDDDPDEDGSSGGSGNTGGTIPDYTAAPLEFSEPPTWVYTNDNFTKTIYFNNDHSSWAEHHFTYVREKDPVAIGPEEITEQILTRKIIQTHRQDELHTYVYNYQIDYYVNDFMHTKTDGPWTEEFEAILEKEWYTEISAKQLAEQNWNTLNEASGPPPNAHIVNRYFTNVPDAYLDIYRQERNIAMRKMDEHLSQMIDRDKISTHQAKQLANLSNKKTNGPSNVQQEIVTSTASSHLELITEGITDGFKTSKVLKFLPSTASSIIEGSIDIAVWDEPELPTIGTIAILSSLTVMMTPRNSKNKGINYAVGTGFTLGIGVINAELEDLGVGLKQYFLQTTENQEWAPGPLNLPSRGVY